MFKWQAFTHLCVGSEELSVKHKTVGKIHYKNHQTSEPTVTSCKLPGKKTCTLEDNNRVKHKK